MIAPRRTAAGLAIVAAATGLFVAGAKKDDQKSAEPFFHQFLIPGDPLDEKLLAQEKLVAESPDSPALRNDFGNLLAERRFPKEARAEYRKALDLDKHFFLAAYNMGLMEETEGNDSSAISAYKEAISRRRGFPPAHFRLGRLYEKAGNSDAAIDEYAKAIEIDDSLRDPKRNPLIIDSRLIDRASLVNYPRDVARASGHHDFEYVDAAKFRELPIDRSLDTSEVVPEETGPQTIETKHSPPAVGNRAPPMPTPARATARPNRPGRRDPSVRPPAELEPTPEPTPQPVEVEPTPEPQTQRPAHR